MKKSTLPMISILIVLFGLFCAVQDVFAVDPPHNGQNTLNMTMSCTTCHYDSTGPTPSWATQPTTTDETFYNNLCTSCHQPAKIVDSSYVVKTHSSQNSSGKYLNWTVECRRCHNPHLQDQVSSYPTDSTANLLTSTIAVTVVQVPVSAPSSTIYVNNTLTPNAWMDYIIIPNIAYPTKMYLIRSNTTNAINVSGSINARYAPKGSTYAIRTGTMVLGQILTPNGTAATVKFFTNDSSKPNSYASSTMLGNVTGICQVCHTQTTSFNGLTGPVQEGPTHPPVIATGAICTDCHIHTQGFQGGCNACHGYPPDSTATLVFKDKTGVTVTSDSGVGPGAHTTHVNTVKLVCANCHANGMLLGQTAGDNKINIGFNWNGDTSGSYDGKPGRLVYPLTGTNVTFGNTNRCSNIYCHSSGQGPTANDATPVYATPQWNDPASGACGSCHQTKAGTLLGAISSGSHTVHMGATSLVNGCGDCHAGAANDASSYDSTNHLNKLIDVASGYDKGGSAGNGYGTCNASSCHVSVYSISSVTSPTWGTTGNGCSACHTIAITATGPNTGGHALHNDTNCVDCHYPGTTSTQAPSTNHANGNIDIANVGYPAIVAKHAANSGYMTCSTASCHADPYGPSTSVTPTWGTSGNGCNACHSAYPIAAYGPNTGGHAQHNDTTCTHCHNPGTTATTKPTTSHANGNIDIANVGYPAIVAKHAANSGYTTCSTASCHANVYGIGTSVTPTWGTSGNGCNACHSIPIDATGPNTGSHAQHNDTTCTHCHNPGTTATTKPTTSHANGYIDVTNGYPPNKAKGSAGSYCSTASCHGAKSPTWGINTSNNTCTKCHGTGTVGTVDGTNRYVVAPPVSVAGNTGTLTGTGQVSSDAKVGAHQTHLRMLNGLSAFGTIDQRCEFCHGTLPVSGTHASGSSAPTWSGLATNYGTMSPAPTYVGTTCNNTYCHNPAGTGGTLNAANAGTDVSPDWTNAAYIGDGTLKTATNCSVCHKSPWDAGFTSTYDHGAITPATDCSTCHGHNGDTLGGAGQRHMDGVKYGGGGSCNACHDYDVDPITQDWGSKPKAIEGWGAHATHINHLKSLSGVTLSAATNTFGGAAFNQVCGVCHTKDSAKHVMGGSPVRYINFGDGSLAYQFSVSSGTPTYTGVAGVSSATTPKTCSNVSCHFQASPVWEGL